MGTPSLGAGELWIGLGGPNQYSTFLLKVWKLPFLGPAHLKARSKTQWFSFWFKAENHVAKEVFISWWLFCKWNSKNALGSIHMKYYTYNSKKNNLYVNQSKSRKKVIVHSTSYLFVVGMLLSGRLLASICNVLHLISSPTETNKKSVSWYRLNFNVITHCCNYFDKIKLDMKLTFNVLSKELTS